MTAIDRTPSNPNFLSRAGFKFIVQRAPHLNFFVQKINLPTISIERAIQPNPFVSIHHSGDHIQYDPLTVTFRVDENMNNWLAMYNWMKGLGFPEHFGQYGELAAQDKMAGGNIKSDVKLFILTSHRNAQIEINFRDAQPFMLSGIDFDSTLDNVDYFEASVSFSYTLYEINTGPL